jgi:mono/diheme cytochrome c family protein
MRRLVLVLLASAVPLFPSAPAAAQTAGGFFDDNCAGCHTIGGGPSGGPDLQGVTRRRDRDWLIRFMLDPEAFASDPLVVRMTKEADGMTMSATPGLTRDLAEAILALIEQRSGAGQASAAAPAEAPFTAADVARGRDLFIGSATLSASGPACIACHESGDVPAPGGGRLGPDLTRVHERLGGRRGLIAWLGTTPTPMMRAVFRPAPLTPEESRALTAFLEHSAARGVASPSGWSAFILGGLGGTAAMLVVIGVVGAKRLRAVRRPLVEAMNRRTRVVSRHAPGASALHAPGREGPGAHDPGGPR